MKNVWLPGIGIVTLLILLMAVACAPASPLPLAPQPPAPLPPPTPALAPDGSAWNEVVQAATKEGKVTVYSTFAIREWRKAFGDLMKERYGITIDWVFGTGAANAERIRVEHETRQVVADVYHAGPIPFIPLKTRGFIVPFPPPEVGKAPQDAWHLGPTAYEPDKVVIATSLSAGTTAWVNTNLVKPQDYPKSYQDILDPRWSGKMNLQDPTFGGSGSRVFYWLSKVYGLDYWEKMARQRITIVRTYGDIVSRLVAGEDALATQVNLPYIIDAIKARAPVEPLLMKEGLANPTIAMSVTAGAPHPNAAKVFINLALTEAGQATMSLIGHAPVRKGVKLEWPHPLVAKIMDHGPRVTFNIASDQEHDKLINDKVAARLFRLGEFAR